jgi:hypothetical protein
MVMRYNLKKEELLLAEKELNKKESKMNCRIEGNLERIECRCTCTYVLQYEVVS